MVWTRFSDMNSGGGRKEPFAVLYIEAPETEAKAIFYHRFGHNPERVTCTCCGGDYSISEEPTLEQASGYERGCKFDSKADAYLEEADDSEYGLRWKTYVPLDQYIADKNRVNGSFRDEKVEFIFEADIKPEERAGAVPAQGYVWVE